MKFLLLLVLAVAVHAEAEPAFAYGWGGHYAPITYAASPVVHPYAATPLIYHTPLVYTTHSGCQNVAGAVVPCALGSLPFLTPSVPVAAEPSAVETVDRKKREAEAEADPEAEAEAEAEAWVYYRTHGYWPHGYSGYSHYAPHSYSYAPFTYGAHYGYYGLGGHGYWGRKKREADPEAVADPEADPKADPWLLYGGLYGHGAPVYGGHYGYGYHHALPYYVGGCRNYLGGLVPCAGRR